MADRTRTQGLGCGAVVAFGVGVVVLSELASLAVGRWGVIAFALILAAMVAAVFGLVAKGWMRRKGEDTSWMLLAVLGITTSNMIEALGVGVPFWGWSLGGIVVALAVWLLISHGVPWWQSRRGDSHQ